MSVSMYVIVRGCIVHNRKYLSTFHRTIKQLRRTNEFSLSILRQLPKWCCSCCGPFVLDCLRAVCRQINDPSSTEKCDHSKSPVHFVVLSLPPQLTYSQKTMKMGRFIGCRCVNLYCLEHHFNARLYLVNCRSSKHLRNIVDQLKNGNEGSEDNKLWVITTMNDENSEENISEEIEQAIKRTWDDASVQITVRSRCHSSKRIRFHYIKPHRYRQVLPVSTPIIQDTRWKSKNRSWLLAFRQKQKHFVKQLQVTSQVRAPLRLELKVERKSSRINRWQKNLVLAMLE